ncbi:hypothetical protein HHK36_005135 [Tetracentron sinense]|uniref:Multiprotein bridging factor 1 N-terminal domain-containing protein n=1 Tax=Tetracentron sinense TaxID=13715 RepID=A0A835DM43_TETSI|nr:hypothetical protein HHK36_005135 [Tetracentron sinense]
MAGVGPLTQDWEPVVVRKKAPTSAAKKDEKAVNAARRSGADIETVKKSNAGTNKAASSSTSLNTRKLDDETENLARGLRVKRVLMRKDLPEKAGATAGEGEGDGYEGPLFRKVLINEKPQIIQEYESGKAIPNQQIITKLERALSVKLRGKK